MGMRAWPTCFLLFTATTWAAAAEDIDKILADYAGKAAKAQATYQGEVGRASQEAIKALERIAQHSAKGKVDAALAWKAVLQLDRKHVEARRYFTDLGKLDAVLKELDEDIDPLGNPVTTGGIPVTLVWNCADDLDVYLDGHPLRVTAQDFHARGDEAHQEYTAPALLTHGAVLAVAGKRGGAYGFMLVALDKDKKVVWRTETTHWRLFTPTDATQWFMPAVIKGAKSSMPTVVPTPWSVQVTMQQRYTPAPDPLWAAPTEPVAYFYSVIE